MKTLWKSLLYSVLMGACATISRVHAQQPLCARVKIEIRQDVTLERQAFEATMTINNSSADKTLTDVNVDVLFQTSTGVPVEKTSDPSNSTAKFFINMTSGGPLPTTVAPSSAKTIKWLIIPM